MSNTIEDLKILRMKEVTALIGLSRSTVYDKMDPKSPRHDPNFPRQIRLSQKAVGWRQGDVIGWLSNRPLAPDTTHTNSED